METLKLMKADLYAMAGEKGGMDLAEDTKEKVMAHLESFAEFGPENPEKMNLDGTAWQAAFTTSAPVAGMRGPFQFETLQIFPADKPGTFVNVTFYFGKEGAILKDEFPGKCALLKKKNMMSLSFDSWNILFRGKQIFSKEFGPDFVGSHEVLYADDNLRIFKTNLGSLTAVYEVSEGKSTEVTFARYQ